MGFEIITKRCPSAAGLGLEPRYIAPEAIVRPIRRPRNESFIFITLVSLLQGPFLKLCNWW